MSFSIPGLQDETYCLLSHILTALLHIVLNDFQDHCFFKAAALVLIKRSAVDPVQEIQDSSKQNCCQQKYDLPFSDLFHDSSDSFRLLFDLYDTHLIVDLLVGIGTVCVDGNRLLVNIYDRVGRNILLPAVRDIALFSWSQIVIFAA